MADPPRFIDIVISLLAYSAQTGDNHTVTIPASPGKTDTEDSLILEVQDDGQTFSEAHKKS